MAVKLYMPFPFDVFRYEGDVVGRLVVEYGGLEWDLCLLLSHVVQDFDLAVKTLYRTRGETQRIDVADAIIRNRISLKVRQTYEMTLAHMRICLKIRNIYAHSTWVHMADDRLAFADIEEMAKSHDQADMTNAAYYHLTKEVLNDQGRFFMEVMQNMRYLAMEVQHLNGTSETTGFHYVENIKRPMMAQKVGD